MKLISLVEAVSAIHLSFYVTTNFPERGGLMFRGHPGSLKTAITETVQTYPNAKMYSDMTVKQGSRIRSSLVCHTITTIAFADLQKLYERNMSSAANMEGYLRGLAGEGWRQMNWEDPRMNCPPAFACIIGCLTEDFYQQKFSSWHDNGFLRRFLWCSYRLHDPNAIIEAIIENRRIDFTVDGFSCRQPITVGAIPFDVSREESEKLYHMLRDQPFKEIPLSTLKKMLAALKWKYGSKKAWQLIDDFSSCLLKDGAELILPKRMLPQASENGTRRKATKAKK